MIETKKAYVQANRLLGDIVKVTPSATWLNSSSPINLTMTL